MRDWTTERIERRIAELEERQAKATSWGAAVGAREEEIRELHGELARRAAPRPWMGAASGPENEWRVRCNVEGECALLRPNGGPLTYSYEPVGEQELREIAAALNEREALRTELDAARARIEELEAALLEAIDGYAECSQYKGDFLRAKHRDERDLARLRAIQSRNAS